MNDFQCGYYFLFLIRLSFVIKVTPNHSMYQLVLKDPYSKRALLQKIFFGTTSLLTQIILFSQRRVLFKMCTLNIALVWYTDFIIHNDQNKQTNIFQKRFTGNFRGQMIWPVILRENFGSVSKIAEVEHPHGTSPLSGASYQERGLPWVSKGFLPSLVLLFRNSVLSSQTIIMRT